MLIFFDILALDEEQVLGLKQHERRRLLERIIRRIPGRADLADYQIINFSSPGAAKALRSVFAKCIVTGGEGLVLKPTDEPYFNFENTRTYRSCCIKLKKEAIGNFGDVGDFAIVGATYDPVKAKTYGIPFLRWTDFYIGCLENKDDVLSSDMKPRFVVVTTVSLNQQILEALVYTHNIATLPYGDTDHFDLRIENGINQGKKPSVIFINPPVVDIRCFAFDKEGNTGFWTMRFPTVTKLHADRTFLDTISFVELQQMAGIYKTMPNDEAEEELRWIKLLEAADPRDIAVDVSTQHTISLALTTPSPRRLSLEDPAQCQAFLIREDTAERQQQAPDRDVFIADGLDNRYPYSAGSVGSHLKFERRSSPLSPTSSKIHKTSPSSKRTREVRSENPIQQSKRPKISESSRSSCLTFPTNDNPSVAQPAMNRPLSDITTSSMKLCTPPKLCKWLSTIQKSSSGAAGNQTRDLTKSKTYSANGTPYIMPCNIDSTSSALRGKQATEEHAKPSNTSKGSLCRIPKAVPNILKVKAICQQASISCLFTNCSLLLAPFVAGMTQLTENLLPSHGACSILDPSLWLDPATFPKRRLRRLALVEPKRVQETVRIFEAIQDLNLVKGDGKRDWVEVYDFRIVECVSKVERGNFRLRYDIWRHFWVGAA
jgi:DNA ligase 4